ncbi:hypothetical protein E4U09_002083 [Claviceps aff. purpurea]|uniref:Uncharacterized protein n=1 Tax=Claviceps aff. purpurea TaxID=1967640 RepID=A0A9P7QGH1_9HYPO|nr:hypothetical protein E4U09_002083 [Claviceps aff. purpurea]
MAPVASPVVSVRNPISKARFARVGKDGRNDHGPTARESGPTAPHLHDASADSSPMRGIQGPARCVTREQ